MKLPNAMVEARIRAAERAGAFEALPGAGKPLPPDVTDGLGADERFQVLLARSVGHLPEEVELLREIHLLEERLAAGDDAARPEIAKRRLRLTMLHEANGRPISARRSR